MRILITGGTGLIGRRLCAALHAQGHQLTVLSRRSQQVSTLCGAGVLAMSSLDEYQTDTHFDAVINLAGEPIVDTRWSESRKQILRQSRIDLTEGLMQKMREASSRPQIFLSGSAIGYYGDGGDVILSEQAEAGGDFGAQLCVDWEAAAMAAAAMGIRTCILRTGLVLDSAGGMLQKMHLPFSLGLGARIGNGYQWMSWIHIDDYVAILLFLLQHKSAAGCFNMVAPEPVTNRKFTRLLALALRRPVIFVTPAFLLKLVLGEMSELLIGGQRVIPAKISALGYQFKHPSLLPALTDLLKHTK
ncbi:TIGR01777 family oxidoreductase [Undibacterium sp. SXout11W]|uniref:TIGR01777 family oxidoreductase n=1 Tax=Undibacterium sp. SXout11W TaxID=3413050 RepID=UPI003BEFCC49